MSSSKYNKWVATSSLLVLATFADMSSASAAGTCTTNASGNVLCQGGTITTPLTVYDGAAAFQPIAGSNSYTPNNPAFPAATNPKNPGYNPNPATVFVTIDPTANLSITTNLTSALADKGVIAANYSNNENPAVNTVTVDNAGIVAITTSQIATSRMHAIVGDSQVNVFTVNNAAGGTISATQNFFGATFSASKLTAVSSNATPPAPSTYSARYNGSTLNIVSALYSDDNTNSFVINNAGTIAAKGNFAAAYYGRADTQITNSGTFGNSSWTPSSTLSSGTWAIGTYAGADFAILPGSNPDTPVYNVQNIVANAQGIKQGAIAVIDASVTALTNTATGIVNGDIVVLDTTPLVTAAATAQGLSLPLASSGSNSGPRDSMISNAGTINGNLYLGSGTHVIDNTGTLNGGINVDQGASVGVFAAAVPGTVAGTYANSATGTDANGKACSASGANTTDPLCAKTQNVLAKFVGGQSLTLTNEGAMTGDIVINDQAGSVNAIALTGTGFAGNVVAKNGTGSNSLTLDGVTNLASVRNFSALNLMTSQVTVTNGVSLVDGSTLTTTIAGPAGTAAAPSRNLGTIYGTLVLAGTTTVTPTFTAIAHNGDRYVLASSVFGPGAAVTAPTGSALVSTSVSAASGALVLAATVVDPRTIPGLSSAGGATLATLLSYVGGNAKPQALGMAVEAIGTMAGVRAAGESLRPSVNGAAIQVPIAIGSLFQDQIDTRLDTLLYAQVPVNGRSADLGPARVVEPVLASNAVWASAIEGTVSQGAIGPIAGYTANLSGVIGGYDRLIMPGLRAGGAFGYVDTHVHDNQTLVNTMGNQTYQGLVYAAIEQPTWYARGSAAFGGLNYNTTRVIAFPGFGDTALGNHKGTLFTGRVEGGYPIAIAGSIVLPYTSFTYARVQQDGYSERSANGAGLTYQAASNDSDRASVGAKALIPIGALPGLAFLTDGASAIAIELRGAYAHEFGTVGQTVTAGFVGSGSTFVASGPNPSREMVDFGAGLNLATSSVIFSLTYNGVARSTYLEQVGLFKARYVF